MRLHESRRWPDLQAPPYHCENCCAKGGNSQATAPCWSSPTSQARQLCEASLVSPSQRIECVCVCSFSPAVSESGAGTVERSTSSFLVSSLFPDARRDLPSHAAPAHPYGPAFPLHSHGRPIFACRAIRRFSLCRCPPTVQVCTLTADSNSHQLPPTPVMHVARATRA